MRIVRFIIQKEFLQIFRNRIMLAFIMMAPLIQLVILAYAATFEIKNIDLFLVDKDKSSESRALIDRFSASENFNISGHSDVNSAGDQALLSNSAIMVLEIPADLDRALVNEGVASVSFRLDAVDGYSANIVSQYAMRIIQLHNKERLFTRFRGNQGSKSMMHNSNSLYSDQNDAEWNVNAYSESGSTESGAEVENGSLIEQGHSLQLGINVSRWYNPELNYQIYMVPGILVLLITVIGGFLSGMNIVREKEIGTMEQLNVTPVSKMQFIIGKLTPFLILSLIMFSFGLLLAKYWFHVPFEGSLWLIYLNASIYLMVILGLGLLVSTVAETQQQAIFITWFVFVIFILLSGLFTPIDSMPPWAQYLTWANPVAWFIDIIRRIMLTGAGFQDVLSSLLVLLTGALILIAGSIMRYRKSAV